VTKLACPSCGHAEPDAAFKPTAEERRCPDCGASMVEPWKLKPRTPMRRVSEKREGEAKRRGSTLKQGRGLAASLAQQKKVRDLRCIHCGRDRHETSIQAAHVYPRRFATCDCADGVVPLCAEGHRLFDEGKLDLLPLLLTNGYRAELVHAMVEHEAPPMHVMEIVTGCVWAPVSEPVSEVAA
jgi:hypothetical protein